MRALIAFEAAARHESFRAAAQELNVTHSAISHQIRELEAELGVPLFVRHGRSVTLSQAGRLYLPSLRESFDRISESTALVRDLVASSGLTVQVYVTMAMRWLIRLLHRFETRYPDMTINLHTTFNDWSFDPERSDAGIIHVRGAPDRANRHEFLFRPKMFPICAPGLVAGSGPAAVCEVLEKQPWLRVAGAEADWPHWLGRAGLGHLVPPQERVFDSHLLTYEAAVAGQGVAMGMAPFVADDLAAGRLIKPLDLAVEQSGGWFFAYPAARFEDPRVRRFLDWLRSEIQSDPNFR